MNKPLLPHEHELHSMSISASFSTFTGSSANFLLQMERIAWFRLVRSAGFFGSAAFSLPWDIHQRSSACYYPLSGNDEGRLVTQDYTEAGFS